jgi:hypothetical protein
MSRDLKTIWTGYQVMIDPNVSPELAIAADWSDWISICTYDTPVSSSNSSSQSKKKHWAYDRWQISQFTEHREQHARLQDVSATTLLLLRPSPEAWPRSQPSIILLLLFFWCHSREHETTIQQHWCHICMISVDFQVCWRLGDCSGARLYSNLDVRIRTFYSR